jgi:hypothetical protein
MQAVHELGHVLHAWLSGGVVQHVILHPLTISFTDVRPNPRPLFVAWGGVVWGTAIPLLVWLVTRAALPRYAWLAKFFAGFCLLANGLYLAAALWQPAGDAQALLQFGAPLWLLVTAGLLMAAGGLWCWNGLGQHFGWRRDGQVDAAIAWSLASMLVITLAI